MNVLMNLNVWIKQQRTWQKQSRSLPLYRQLYLYIQGKRELRYQGAPSSRSMSVYEHGNPVVCEPLKLAASCVTVCQSTPRVFKFRNIQAYPIYPHR